MTESLPDLSTPRPPFWASFLVCALLVLAMLLLCIRLMGHYVLPVGYGIPLVICAWTRDRRLLWAMTGAFVGMTLYKFLVLLPDAHVPAHAAISREDWLDAAAVLADLLGVAALVDFWIRSRRASDDRHAELSARSRELAARRAEIARQNEELQSQADELERQGEELRVANEDLAHREKMLESLLELSRSLTVEMDRGDVFSRICTAIGELLGGPNLASSILEVSGDRLSVVCHHGFGPEGPDVDSIPYSNSFAKLVLGDGRTGCLEDVSLRPELRIPQRKSGVPLRSVLATPLRAGGKSVASLEVYAGEKYVWTASQIALIESLGAQTSVSLEAHDLFEQVEREHRRLQAVLNTVPFGIGIANADCSVVKYNAAGSTILGVALGESSGKHDWAGRLTLSDGSGEMTPDRYPIIRAAHGETVPAEELQVHFVNGPLVFLLSSAAPIKAADGSIIGAVSAFVDITEQKNLERELDTRRRDAEEASVRKSRFLAAVSHDIRTPANAISLLAELIQRTAASPAMIGEVPELAKELQNSATLLVNLVGDVLDLTRLDTGKIDLHETEFALGDMLTEEVRQLAPLANQKSLLLDCEQNLEGVKLRGDRIKIARVVGNLVSNAIKFTEQGGVRLVAQVRPDGIVELKVVDTGIGIPAEALPRIFDEFFQLKKPGRDRNAGNGLGLAICNRLLDAMGGKLSVHSEIDKGSTFTAELPAAMVVK